MKFMKAGMRCLLAAFCFDALSAHSQTNVITNSTVFVYVGGTNGSIKVMEVETAETQEQNSIKAQAGALIKTKDFDALDSFAAKYRLSGESFPNGCWKLGCVYSGLSPSETNTDAEWDDRLAVLRQWIAAKPDSITPRVALAGALIDYAWRARGGGWANTVTPDGWRLFGQRLHQAQTVLDEALEIKSSCPVYWSYQMTVARGLAYDKDLFRVIFKQATNAHPGYLAYQMHRAIYLLPRWGGEPGEWERELTEAADDLGGDAGDAMYARVVWYVHGYGGTQNIFDENQLSWPRVNRGFEVIEKQYPDSLAAKSERAHLAALAKDKVNTRKYFEETDGKIDLTTWRSSDHYIRAMEWAYAQ